MSRTPRERLADISEAADGVRRAVKALERAEADNADDDAQLAFDALLYRLVVIGEAVKALPAELLASQPHVPVDLFTMSDESIGGLAYQPPLKTAAFVTQREAVTVDAAGRSERRAERLSQTAPPAPAREPRRLFDREVRGDWVTADLAAHLMSDCSLA